MDKTILVTGGTGKTGRRVVRILQERGMPVRAASRSSATRFDWADPDTWGPALRGVSAVYLVNTDLGSPEAADAVASFAHQAAGTAVRRAVMLSVPESGSAYHEPVSAAERALDDAGLEPTVLRARWFFQNFSEDFLLKSVLSGELRLPTGDGKEAFIDAQDIAAVAVAALTEEGHSGRAYELTGPRLMSFTDTAAEIARATGRDFRYAPLTPEAYAAEQQAQGVPEEWVRLSLNLYTQVSSGSLASLTDDVERVLGRPPRDFADYARETAAEGTWLA